MSQGSKIDANLLESSRKFHVDSQLAVLAPISRASIWPSLDLIGRECHFKQAAACVNLHVRGSWRTSSAKNTDTLDLDILGIGCWARADDGTAWDNGIALNRRHNGRNGSNTGESHIE